jgi:hypothetical protein
VVQDAVELLPLALLAPEIVEAICAGRQPLELSTEELTRRIDLPLDWRERRWQLNSAA